MDPLPKRDWLTIITNLGVVIGLVFVAFQMQQTNEALELQSLEARISASEVPTQLWDDWHSDIATSDEAADIWRIGNAGEELSPNEAIRYNALATRFYWNTFVEQKVGTEGSGYTESGAIQRMVLFARRNPGFDRWLRQRLADSAVSGFAQKVQKLLNQSVEQ